ncbi:hypothetical protein [Planctobacterium marinum]|uniref:Uncharacterized protein n=1 Tax=Planctobacterium marinum TaxID=1631968 RepID=A0AA48HN70_9ALTE|nr:hypothetical protein MACH26_38250 [Planctobacterium marinum]
MTPARFDITTHDKVICVTLRGDWHPVIDLCYMSQLSDMIKRVNNKTWALLVDMRDCHIHANNIAGQFANSLNTDRRNQTQEVWIVDRADQGDFLLSFGSTNKVKVHKCFSLKESCNFLQKQGFNLPIQLFDNDAEQHALAI